MRFFSTDKIEVISDFIILSKKMDMVRDFGIFRVKNRSVFGFGIQSIYIEELGVEGFSLSWQLSFFV